MGREVESWKGRKRPNVVLGVIRNFVVRTALHDGTCRNLQKPLVARAREGSSLRDFQLNGEKGPISKM